LAGNDYDGRRKCRSNFLRRIILDSEDYLGCPTPSRNRRGPATFKQRDVTRAIKAMIAAGVQGSVRIETCGALVVTIGKQQESSAMLDAANDNSPAEINDFEDLLNGETQA
jgi:hypothetical protein